MSLYLQTLSTDCGGRAKTQLARGQSLEALADAAAPLYAILSEEQKHRLPVLMHGFRPHFASRNFAMMGGGHEGWEWRRSNAEEHEGFAPEDGDYQSPKDR
jgi:hypothetical protein